MKVEQLNKEVTPEFIPIELKITITSKDELRALVAVLNISSHHYRTHLTGEYDIEEDTYIANSLSSPLWKKLDDIWEELYPE